MSDCLFCKIAAGEIPSNKVYEDELVYAFYASGLTAAVMFRRPVKRMPKPIVMLPTVSLCGVLMAMMKRMPAMAARGASVEGLKMLSHAPPSALRSSSRMI